MTDAPPTSANPGRWIRAALVILPFGTILLGIASFGIWQWKKDQAADRSFRYAMALRKPISQKEIQRHAAILRTALSKPDWQLSIPAYFESTLGTENMGYNVRRIGIGNDLSLVDGELTGKRPREVVLLLLPYSGDPGHREATALAMAEALSVAHEVTGQNVARTLRFVAMPDTPEAVTKLKASSSRASERLMLVVVPGGPDAATLTRLDEGLEVKKYGTQVVTRPAAANAEDAFRFAQELKTVLLTEAEKS